MNILLLFILITSYLTQVPITIRIKFRLFNTAFKVYGLQVSPLIFFHLTFHCYLPYPYTCLTPTILSQSNQTLSFSPPPFGQKCPFSCLFTKKNSYPPSFIRLSLMSFICNDFYCVITRILHDYYLKLPWVFVVSESLVFSMYSLDTDI